MTERWGLERSWAAIAARALSSEGEVDLVLEALAMAGAVDLVPGMLDAVGAPERRKLAARGAALLLSSRIEGDDDEAVARGRALALARDGLGALRPDRGRRPTSDPPAASATSAVPVAPAALRRLLVGGLDGFAAAELARRLRGHPSALSELRVLASHGTPEAAPASSPSSAATASPSTTERTSGPSRAPSEAEGAPLRLVADDATGVRDPGAGESVGAARSGSVELEAVRFSDGVVAIYAAPAKRISVPVLPTGVKVVRTAVGYVELDVRKARAAEVEVAVGSHRVPITIR